MADFIQIVGRFGLSVDDGSDAGAEPDRLRPEPGATVELIPYFDEVHDSGTNPPEKLGIAVRTCYVDPEGYLVSSIDEDESGNIVGYGPRSVLVENLAAPRYGLTIPEDVGQWRAVYQDFVYVDEYQRTYKVPYQSQWLDLVDGEINDLSVVGELPTGGGQPIIRGPRGFSIKSLAVQAGQLVVGLEGEAPEGTSYVIPIDTVVPQTPGKNLFNLANAATDKYWAQGANPTTLAGYVASEKIPVVPGATYTVQKARIVQGFSSAGAYTNALTFSNDPTFANRTFTIPATGVAFVGISTTNAFAPFMQLELGSTATAYEDFGQRVNRLLAGGRLLDTKLALLDEASGPNARTDLSVYRDGDNMLVRCAHDSATDIVMPLSLSRTQFTPGDLRVSLSQTSWSAVRTIPRGLLDSAMWPIPPALPGTQVAFPGDDNPPIFACGSYIGGNHGWNSGAQVTVAGHGKTTADLGSQWTDGARTYTLLRINSASQLLFGTPYTVTSGRVTATTELPSGPLTHVSGATNTTTVPISGGQSLVQIRPTSHSQSVAATLDGKKFGNGITRGRALEVTETYTLVSYKGLIDWSRANVGVDPFANLTAIPSLARVSNSYRFGADRNLIVGQTVTPLEEFSGFLMVTQADALINTSGSLRQYFPGATGTKVGLNLATEAALSAQTADLVIALTQQQQAADPISRIIQWHYTTGGVRDVGFEMGLLPVMDGKPAIRKTNNTDAESWYLATSTKKNYPRLTGPRVFAVGVPFSGRAFRRYLSPEDPPEVVVSDGDRRWVLIDTPTGSASTAIAKLPTVEGRGLVDVETSTVARSRAYVTPEGITYTVTAPGHMMAEARVDTTV